MKWNNRRDVLSKMSYFPLSGLCSCPSIRGQLDHLHLEMEPEHIRHRADWWQRNTCVTQ